jgi:hypothetical protein
VKKIVLILEQIEKEAQRAPSGPSQRKEGLHLFVS